MSLDELTELEIVREWNYRYEERLGIMCEDREPSSEQIMTAAKCAEQWEKAYRDQLLNES